MEPPLDHAELCARLRFRLDEPRDLPPDELAERERQAINRSAKLHALGLRVTRTLTPGLFAKCESIGRRLLLKQAPAVYVLADSTLNASAFYGGRRHVITVTSALTTLLTLDEWGAVLGHELAHVGMRHSHPDADDEMSRVFALERSRAAEISCDRMSVVAGGSPKTAISALVKVTSGLGEDHMLTDVDAFLAQLTDRPEDADLEWEALETHPMLPFRVWAMSRFSQTDLCRALLGQDGGEPFETVEAEICSRFHAVGEGLVGRAVTDNLHEALAWIAALLICEDGRHSEQELATLASVAGSVWAEDVLEYVRVHGLRATESRAKQSLGRLAGSGKPVRARTMSHVKALTQKLGSPKARKRAEELVEEAWRPPLGRGGHAR